MTAFVNAISPVLPSKCRRVLGTKRGRSPRVVARFYARPVTMLASSNSSGGVNEVPANSQKEKVASWQEELKMLLDPTMPVGVKQVLVQDLAKRAPEVFNDVLSGKGCADIGLRGVGDVIRQFQEDLLPDLVSNGPRYVAKAAEDFPNAISSMSSSSSGMPSNMPTPVSPEEVQREFRNIFNKTPEGLFTPDYKVLGQFEGYEIRQYPTLIIAETKMTSETASASGATEVESASAMGQSFNNLAGYLFGKNESKTAMKMTTPVILSKGEPEETMSFIIGEYDSVEAVPKTLDDTVKLREQAGQVLAVSEFTGFVTQGEAKRQRKKLMDTLARDNIALGPDGESSYKCMIYNGPSTLPNLRRNEMMVEVVYSTTEEDVS